MSCVLGVYRCVFVLIECFSLFFYVIMHSYFVFYISLCSLVSYVAENEGDDPLINPVEYNPFKEKPRCLLF